MDQYMVHTITIKTNHTINKQTVSKLPIGALEGRMPLTIFLNQKTGKDS